MYKNVLESFPFGLFHSYQSLCTTKLSGSWGNIRFQTTSAGFSLWLRARRKEKSRHAAYQNVLKCLGFSDNNAVSHNGKPNCRIRGVTYNNPITSAGRTQRLRTRKKQKGSSMCTKTYSRVSLLGFFTVISRCVRSKKKCIYNGRYFCYTYLRTTSPLIEAVRGK